MALLKRFSGNTDVQKEDSNVLSIIDNLNNILNTRKGYGSLLQDFGILDINEYRSRSAVARKVMEEVKNNVEQYEPRLENVSIALSKTDNPAYLTFDIECTIRKSEQVFHLIFDSFVRKFQVSHPGAGY